MKDFKTIWKMLFVLLFPLGLIKVSCGQGTFHVADIEYKENGKDTTDKCIKLCVITPSTGYHRCNPNITTFTTETRIRKGNMKGYPDPYEHDFKYVDWEDNSELSVTVWKRLKGQSCDTPGSTNSTYYGEATAVIPRLEKQKEYSIVSDKWELNIQTYLKCNKTGCLLPCVPRDNSTGHYTCVDGNKKCLTNWFGENCTTFCNLSSSTYTCDVNGKKSCLKNWFGTNCSKFCDNSSKTYTCDNTGQKHCKTANYYGEKCSTFCNTSEENQQCSSNGDIICKNNWFGNVCDKFCNISAENFNCTSNGSKVCNKNWFGKDCDIFCHENKSKYRCNSDGRKSCLPDWYGENCVRFCNKSSRFYQCSENGEKYCNPEHQCASHCENIESVSDLYLCKKIDCPHGWITCSSKSMENENKEIRNALFHCKEKYDDCQLCTQHECRKETPEPGRDPGKSKGSKTVSKPTIYGISGGLVAIALLVILIVIRNKYKKSNNVKVVQLKSVKNSASASSLNIKLRDGRVNPVCAEF